MEKLKKDEPFVSVLMNCYNGEKFLKEAIESVIVQTYQNWELIFWDNQSTDLSAKICQSYNDSRIKYYYAPEHTNIGAARELGYRQAKGEFLAVLDTDDLWLPQKLEIQIPKFTDPEVGIAISDTMFFNDEGLERQLFKYKKPPEGWVFHELLDNYFVSLETVILRCSAINNLKQGFDAKLSHIADFDLIVRVSNKWKLVYCDQILGKWRVHKSSLSWSEPEKFYLEKLIFIEKMDSLTDFQDNWEKSKTSFMNQNKFTGAISCIINDQIGKARTILVKDILSNSKLFLLYILTWLPGGKLAIKLKKKSRNPFV